MIREESSSGPNKAQGLKNAKKEKASFVLGKQRKQLKVESSWLDKAQGLKNEIVRKRALGSKRKENILGLRA